MKHELPKLSYEYNALEPYIDEKTMVIHHTKHHQAYIDKLNAALEKYPELQKKDIKELVRNLNSVPEEIRTAVKNHGGGHFNHSFFWKIMTSNAEKEPKGEIKVCINKDFGSFEKFREQFINSAATLFGSGWTWLVINEKKKLEIINTSNQDNPVSMGKKPLLGIDVWEHSYYLKYQNKRVDYVNAFFNIINWKQVDENLKK